LGGSEERDWDWWSWKSIEVFSSEKRERKEEVDSAEDSAFVERLWGRFDSRSTIAKCFFCFSVSSSIVAQSCVFQIPQTQFIPDSWSGVTCFYCSVASIIIPKLFVLVHCDSWIEHFQSHFKRKL